MCDEEPPSGGEEDQGGGAVLIRIHVPDLNIHKCLQFYRGDLIWDVKQQCLASLPKELKESFNYGLFAPPCNGKAGKFLEEERPLADYPFSGPVGYLELRYKRRLYKGLSVDEKQLKSLHTKSNLRRFLDYVSSGHCEKVTKMCAKGLDSNFHCPETGETPLSMAAVMKKPSKLLMALVNGGALLDYRNKDGSTAMHRAVDHKSLEAVKTMLDLGGSPNYRDAKGLTPLYMSVASNADPALCEALLHDHAFIGAQDLQGWHETHQACRNGLVQHLEHLLYYGADMNARNASGNTPLHVCAVNNQESCARLLLFRGADKEALNFANQTPYQVAVIAGNMELAEIIQNHRAQDVVPFRDLPKYNPKRRSIISRALSDPRLNGSLTCLVGRLSRGPPSPCPSNRSLPPFSSASSCLSECSTNTHSGSCSDSSCYSGGSSHFGSEDNCGSAFTDKSLDHSDITSDSSGVGTCNSGGSGSSYDATPTDPALILPGMMVVCVENFTPQSPSHLKLTEGDIIEVTASTDTGLLEGSLRGQMGLFPASCVQEIRMKVYENRNNLAPPGRTQGRRDANSKNYPFGARIKKIWSEPHTVILHRGQKGFGFVLRGAKSDSPLMELNPADRFPALQYLDDVDLNGVADRAGLRKGDFILAINGMDVTQSSHETVVDLIRKSGELVSMTVVGLSFPIAIPEENSKPGSPSSLTCEQSSNSTPKAQYHFATLPRKYSGFSGPNVPSPPRRDPSTSLSVGRTRAKSMVAALADLGVGQTSATDGSVGSKANSVDSITGKPPLPPTSNGSSNSVTQPKTASIRARPTSSRITASEIHEIFTEHAVNGGANDDKSSWNCPPSPLSGTGHKIYASVSEMKRSKSGLKSKELVKLHKDFHSTPDLKDSSTLKKEKNGSVTKADDGKTKSLSQDNLNKFKSNARHSWACISSTAQSFLERNYENSWKNIDKGSNKKESKKIKTDDGEESDGSTASCSTNSSGKETPKSVKTPILSDAEYRTTKPLRPVMSKTLPRRASTGCTLGSAEQQTINNMVPPGQVIKVDVSKSKEYASLDIASTTLPRRDNSSVMSSFKPTDSAKLYASPDDLRTGSIGYREQGQESNTGTLKKTRAQSLPPTKRDSNGVKGGYAQPDAVRNHNKDNMPDLVNGSRHDDSDAPTPTNTSINSSDSGSSSTPCNTELEIEIPKAMNEEAFDPQKSLAEAKEKLKPVKPVLKCSPAPPNAEPTKIRIEVKQSPRLQRKVEKTVTFQSDPQTHSQPGNQLPHSMSVDEIQKIKTSLKSSKSFPNDLGQEEVDGNSSSGVSSDGGQDNAKNAGGNYVTCVPINPESDSSEDLSDKTWILKDDSAEKENNAEVKISQMQKPLNVSNDYEIKRNNCDKLPPAPPPPRVDEQAEYKQTAAAALHVTSQAQLRERNYRQQMMQIQAAEQADRASNNVLAYGTISRSQQAARHGTGGNLTKNAVSLAKLPPPIELESETEESKSPKDPPAQKKSVGSGTSQMYHTLQPQRSRTMLGDQQQYLSRQLQQIQQFQHQTPQSRQAEKSIEESLKLIQMHMATLKQEFPTAHQNSHQATNQNAHQNAQQQQTVHPNVVPPPPEFGLRNQTPILAPPPEFSDARDHHESATRFNQSHAHPVDPSNPAHLNAQQPFNRQSPMYRSISHAHSSGTSMYSGYPTMTRQQYSQQMHQQQLMQQQYQMQQAQAQAQAQQQQYQQLSHPPSQQQQQQQATYMTSGMPAYQTLSRLQAYSSSQGQGVHNSTAYGHYGTLGNPKVSQQQASQSSAMFPQHQHHPKCYYYQQGSSTPSSAAPSATATPSNPGGKYIPEKLHPVHRYTPDLVDNGPRIVGTIPKKQPSQDHYEVPHAHQQMLLQQQQQQQQQASRVRREFRNKALPDWSVVDACDWLDSLFMPEYKVIFQQRSIDGKKLIRMDNATLLELGIKKLGHRMNIEKSLKRYMPTQKS